MVLVNTRDAFGSLDPFYSSGVLLALKPGAYATDATIQGSRTNDTSAAQLEVGGTEFLFGMDRMRRLVWEINDGLNLGRFVRKQSDRKVWLLMF
ncbi:MAG TPA: hypothetical protein VM260_19580 [Pirellula sp.]|nr:hypothetical protein [Pirellula sp.]